MIRVLHTIDTTGPGGAETVFVNLAKSLDPREFESFAAICGPGWVCDALRKNGIEPVFVNSKGGFNLGYLVEMVRIVRKYRIDVIQAHLFGSCLYAGMAGLICGVPVISTIHGFVDVNDREKLMWLKTRLTNLGSKKIVCVSGHLRKHCVENLGFSGRKAITIYNGVDTSVFHPDRDDSIRKELGLGVEHFVIGAVGNIRPAKGYDIFLRAARIIYDRHPECRILIAGEGSGPLYESLLELRKDLGLEGVFFFTGFREKAAEVFNSLDIFVLPSVSEGFSISTIEAMACGVPVVVTRSGGPEEIVENGTSGITVECTQEDIANGVMPLLENEGLRAALKNRALGEVDEKFSLGAMVEQYRLFYESAG
jgi:glycosyltransferase involved in cell wall biosynthesis